MSESKSFSAAMPNGFQTLVSDIDIAELPQKQNAATIFADGSGKRLELERTNGGRYHAGAIKVMGVNKYRLFFDRRNLIGYIPNELSDQIIGSGIFDDILPQLNIIDINDNGFVEIYFQIIGPNKSKKIFDDFCLNQPASQWQKEFYIFFGMRVPEGLTVGQVSNAISEYENGGKRSLEKWEKYKETYDELSDSFFGPLSGPMEPSLAICRNAVNQLIEDGETIYSISNDIDMLANKINELNSELER